MIKLQLAVSALLGVYDFQTVMAIQHHKLALKDDPSLLEDDDSLLSFQPPSDQEDLGELEDVPESAEMEE